MKKAAAGIALVALFCSLAINSIAQKNFTKGYYITPQNDTVACLIKDKNWQQNPTKVEYRLTETDDIKTFKASEIKGFGSAAGDIYVAAIVTVDKTQSAPTYSPAETTIDTVFLRVLVRGAASLLYLYNGTRDYFYYQDQTGKPTELILSYSLQDSPVSGRTAVVKDEKYKGQLVYYFRDCPMLSGKLAGIPYNTNALSNAFKQYNACVGNEQYVSPQEKETFHFGVAGGASLMRHTFSAVGREDLNKTEFKSPLNYNGGLMLNIVLPRDRQRWSLYNELQWKQYSFSGRYDQFIQSAWEYRTYNTEFHVKSISLSNMLRYQIPVANSKVKAFANIGVANSLLLDTQEYQQVRVSHKFSDKVTTTERAPIGYFRRVELAGVAGAGLQLNKITIEARGELSNGIAHRLIANSNRYSIGLIAGYYFN